MKILLTGAHFTPAQAVIEELKKLENVQIVYVGRNTTREGDQTPSVESQVLPKLGVKFYSLIAGRLRRYLSLGTIISLLKLPVGFLQAFYILFIEKPEVVVSFGGYVSVPVVIAAWLLNIPILIHVQTLVTGLANKINSYFATKIAVSFETHYDFPKGKVVVTGNPIRKELLEGRGKKGDMGDSGVSRVIKLSQKGHLPFIYITGGNQGSHVINEAVEEVLEELLEKAVVIHQTGDSKFKDYERLVEKNQTLEKKGHYLAAKWVGVDDLKEIMENADLVVSRAGINTLLELCYFANPTLVIPIPYLHYDEQNKNARFFEKEGLTRVLPQSKLSGQSLLKEVSQMLKDRGQLKKSAQLSRKFIILDAAKRLSLEIMLLAGKQGGNSNT
jgi:UDP-N-acetylglucosamine--N-acetylmuramyl-(pentapeptide) pyrophosphoryl-undecaprenol N-acetylglucosamine transferase